MSETAAGCQHLSAGQGEQLTTQPGGAPQQVSHLGQVRLGRVVLGQRENDGIAEAIERHHQIGEVMGDPARQERHRLHLPGGEVGRLQVAEVGDVLDAAVHPHGHPALRIDLGEGPSPDRRVRAKPSGIDEVPPGSLGACVEQGGADPAGLVRPEEGLRLPNEGGDLLLGHPDGCGPVRQHDQVVRLDVVRPGRHPGDLADPPQHVRCRPVAGRSR